MRAPECAIKLRAAVSEAGSEWIERTWLVGITDKCPEARANDDECDDPVDDFLDGVFLHVTFLIW